MRRTSRDGDSIVTWLLGLWWQIVGKLAGGARRGSGGKGNEKVWSAINRSGSQCLCSWQYSCCAVISEEK